MARTTLVESIESMVQCTVCLEMMKDPKMLPCLHRFCLPCLQSSISALRPKMRFLCPLCRKPTPIPSGGAKSFQTDFMMKQMVDMILKQKGILEKDEGSVVTGPSLLKIDPYIFPKEKWSVDDICGLPDIIVVVGSSQTLHYALAFTLNGVLCYTLDKSPKGVEGETPYSSCVAAIDDENVVVGYTSKLLVIKILSSKSDFEYSKELPKHQRAKNISANSNSIVVQLSSHRNIEVDEKRFLLCDHCLNDLISIEVDNGRGLVTNICLTDENFYWVDYYTENVFFESVIDFTSESQLVDKNKFRKPSTSICTPLSFCCDDNGYAYVLWRILEDADIVIARGRNCYNRCTKIVAWYNINDPRRIVNKITVDEKSHRISILNNNMKTTKLVIVTTENLFYTYSHEIMQ